MADTTRLEGLKPNSALRGILPDCLVTVVGLQWFGSEALELTYKDPGGRPGNVLLYRHDEPRLEVAEQGRPWSFDGDGALFRLVLEAHRIRLAHLFDPVLAVHTSLVEPLLHQIIAVYDAMPPRQPVRFLLADDPGAGKTIISGLFSRGLELGDAELEEWPLRGVHEGQFRAICENALEGLASKKLNLQMLIEQRAQGAGAWGRARDPSLVSSPRRRGTCR